MKWVLMKVNQVAAKTWKKRKGGSLWDLCCLIYASANVATALKAEVRCFEVSDINMKVQ